VAVAGGNLPALLVTGFGPFPGAPENPTATLIQALAGQPPESFGAGSLKAVVLPTEFAGSWSTLHRLYRSFSPDVVLHFGVSARATEIRIERAARNHLGRGRPDALGVTPRRTQVRPSGAEVLPATLPALEIAAVLSAAGIANVISDDAGDYVCNATFYRSLASFEGTHRRAAFIHVPPREILAIEQLERAAQLILKTATRIVGV
jgi:pyroglutamyl-peptidase